jgi:hypothetical protein
MIKYLEIRQENQKRFNEFSKNFIYWIFAFSSKEFDDQLKEYNLTKDDIISIGAGGFIKKEHKDLYLELLKNIKRNNAFQQIKHDDIEVKKAFIYELSNHEYCVTYDVNDALEALGITEEEIQKDARLKKLLKEAINEYLESVES